MVMDNYSQGQYFEDLEDPKVPHLETREHFKAFYDELGKGPAKDIEYPARMNWVTPGSGSRIIELGCSAGYNVVKWLTDDHECSVVAVDVSSSAIHETVSRIGELPTEAQMRVAVFEAFIEDAHEHISGAFDDVVLTEVLEHVQDPMPILESAWAFVRQGGTLWITTPSRRWGNYSHVRGIRAATLASMLQDIGVDVFDIVEIEEVHSEGECLTRSRIVRRESGPSGVPSR